MILGACTSAPQPSPRLTVTPVSGLFDAPFVTTVTGLQPDQQVTLVASSTDQTDTVWRSAAVFTADEHGVVTTNRAPVAGSYGTADPMGLVETMSTGKPAVYKLGDGEASQFTVAIAVYDGNRVPATPGEGSPDTPDDALLASASVVRLLPSPMVKRIELRPGQPGADGLYADLYLPAAPAAGARPGVIVIGGSKGGMSTQLDAKTLAAHGYPAMALAYFHEPGLPAALRRIPLEYFAAAARHLAHQPGVDPGGITLMGWSRGSEAALLTAAAFPDLVKAAVGGSPASTSNVDPTDLTAASWTLRGADLPKASSQDFYHPNPASPAIIRVEKIAGPILLVCGSQDYLWPSCPNAAALQQRLRTHGRPAAMVLSYPGAGHFVVSPLPYLPMTVSGSSTGANGRTLQVGGTYTADQAARAAAWPKILSFLHNLD